MNIQTFEIKTATVAGMISRNNGQTLDTARAIAYIKGNAVKKYAAMMDDICKDIKIVLGERWIGEIWKLETTKTNLRRHVATFAKEVADNCQQII